MAEKYRVIVANVTWNPFGWKNIYVNPRAGHKYAKKYPGHECLNFKFNEKVLNNEKEVYGYIQWTEPPKNLANNGVIIFYSKNLENYRGEIVGIYGDVKILGKGKVKRTKWNGFEGNELLSNVVAKRELSLLFPVTLDSDRYSQGKRLVPQVGYTYKNIDFAEEIILDEIKELKRAGIKLEEFKKLKNIYKFLTGTNYPEEETLEVDDIKEQEELSSLIKTSQSKNEVIKELRAITPQTPELFEFKGKQYKRDNKTIAQLKILRDFKCQICGTSILKKDNTLYIEAVHIIEKKHKGPETPDNILILCPNHHKEFDLGNKKIIEGTKKKIVFELNGKKYELSLELK